MSALLSLSPSLSLELQQQRDPRLEPAPECRFCHCDDAHPCEIGVREDPDGSFHLARSEEEATQLVYCYWFVAGICNAPACMEKLQQELRDDGFRLVDQFGRRA